MKLTLAILLLGLIGCGKTNTRDLNDDLARIKADADKIGKFDISQLVGNGEGGQPGLISYSKIVKDNEKVISINADSGKGNFGNKPAVAADHAPKVQNELEAAAVEKISVAEGKRFLVTLHCDEDEARALGQQLGLPFRQLKSNELDPVNGKIELTAKAIVMCGEVFSPLIVLPADRITFNTDQLILVNVDYTLQGSDGALTFNTNTLMLVRQNKLATKGTDSLIVTVATPAMNLNVAKDVRVYDGGKLDVSSTGSSFFSMPSTN